MISKSLSFTGHRPQSLPFSLERMTVERARLEMRISDEILRFAGAGCEEFVCGCALGADIIFGEAVIAARSESFSGIKLVCAVPFPKQAASWPAFWRERYDRLLAGADEIKVLSPGYHNGCYHERNRFMVDSTDALLAVYDGKGTGGTAYTVGYARSLGREIVFIDPTECLSGGRRGGSGG